MIQEIESIGPKLKTHLSVKENFRAIDKSTCVIPNPGMSFRPSVPCLGVD